MAKAFYGLRHMHYHFWRHLKMSEMARVYVSMMLRNLAAALTGIFIPIYMMQIGYSFQDVCWLMIFYFGVRLAGIDFLIGKIVASVGPKRTMFIGFIVTAFCMLMFATQEIFWWPIILLGLIYGATHSLIYVPFHAEFSKIHNRSTEGSQLGYLSAFEKLGGVLGPLVGGIIATLFGGQYIFFVGLILLVVAGVPLVRTKESLKTHQKLDYSKLDIWKHRRGMVVFAAAGLRLTMTNPMWQIFLSMTVLTSTSVYAGIGALESISVGVAIVAAIVIGHIVDKHHGRLLLRIGAGIESFFHISRIFITSYIPALMLNIGYEVGRTANDIPRSKGFYDEVDDDSIRTVYIVVAEYIDSVIKTFAWMLILVISICFNNIIALYVAFVIAALSTLLTTAERYKALD